MGRCAPHSYGYLPTPRFRNLQAKRQPTQAPRPTIATVVAAVITALKSIVAIAVAISDISTFLFALGLSTNATIDDGSNESERKYRSEDFDT